MIPAAAGGSGATPAVAGARRREASGDGHQRRRSVGRAGPRRTFAAVASLLLAGLAIIPVAPAAAASATQIAPIATAASARVEEDYRGLLAFDVATVDPAVVTATAPAQLTVTGMLTNTGGRPLTDLIYRFQRGPAQPSEADVRRQLAEPSEPVEHVQADFAPLLPAVAPGETLPFTATVPLAGADGLDLGEPGVYPVMINVNGAVQLDTGPLDARVGELYLMITVLQVPGTAGASAGANPALPGAGTGTATPVPVNVVWPLVDRPHLGVGGIFLNDDLAAAIAPGGRLDRLVAALAGGTAAGTGRGSAASQGGGITLAIDPGLLDELDRMSQGYRVVADPAAPQPSLVIAAAPDDATPAPPTTEQGSPATGGAAPATTAGGAAPDAAGDPAGTATDQGTNDGPVDDGAPLVPDEGTVDGTGQEAAADFLDRLRALTRTYPTLLLPRGDADATALVRSDLPELLTTAVGQGREIADDVLGAGTAAAVDDVALPLNGLIDAATLAALSRDGLTSALLARESVTPSSAADATQVAVDPAQAGGTAAQTGTVPAALSDTDPLTSVGSLVTPSGAPGSAGWALRINAMTAVLAQRSFDGSAVPSVVVPDRSWDPNDATLGGLTGLLAELGRLGVIEPIAVTDLAAAATERAEAAYPEAARAAELSPEYLDRVRRDQYQLDSLAAVLTSLPQAADPVPVLDAMQDAIDASAAGAFRTNASVGLANLATVESTVAGIRGGVAIASAGNSYTLASSSSPLVLTVQNSLPYDVALSVRITGGERVGLTTTDPGVQVIEAGRSQQIKIPAQVSRSGQFQVGAQLVTADGNDWGAPVVLSVESTAYGAVTVIAIIVAGGVLVLMVVLRIVQRLRARRERLAREAAAAARGDTPPGDTGALAVVEDDAMGTGVHDDKAAVSGVGDGTIGEPAAPPARDRPGAGAAR